MLRIDDFAPVFSAIHTRASNANHDDAPAPPRVIPFAWQERLLSTVLQDGWPATIDAPTSTGKTAVLDIALFHLALAASGAACRPAPRRIVFAVDRRVIVDQAFERAKLLRAALDEPQDERVQTMADALRCLAGGEAPLHVEELRGGMPREDEWARSPIQPTILCTTIDQLGSRLLFRGYGVTPSMAPIHAGLLGEDALLLLDEAHLSRPFQQTLEHVQRWREKRTPDAVDRPWAFCTLTATPQSATGRVFRLSDEEKAEPAVAQRLDAVKTAGLHLCKEQMGSAEHIGAFVAAAKELAEQIGAAGERHAPSIAIIVNRVALARAVLRTLSVDKHAAILLTGRVRPVEREKRVLAQYLPRLTSRDSGTLDAAGPLFVVATQCIEAGADFDFDAMVTQIAPLDALRQRFGRLNRLGTREYGPAVIIAARTEIVRGNDDPLYGGTLRETWEWLTARAAAEPRGRPSLAVSPRALEALVRDDPDAAARCVLMGKDAPMLRAADVALLAMTNPAPNPDPYLPLFLRGEVAIETDVGIVWRADCEVIAAPPTGMSRAVVEDVATAIVACQPPVPGETLRVPLWAAKAWLSAQNRQAAEITDAEAERDPHPDERHGNSRLALRWRGANDTALVRADDLRPGDVIVVPSSHGGCDEFGWLPDGREPAEDIADLAAQAYVSRRFALRLHPALWPRERKECVPWEDAWPRLREFVGDNDPGGLLRALQRMRPDLDLPEGLAAAFPRIECPYEPAAEMATPSGAVLIAPRGIADGRTRRPPPPSTEDDTTGCFNPDGSVSLALHTRDVVNLAETFATRLGLGEKLAKTLAFAARSHDAGKADRRFQAWLRGPEKAPGEPLAKSGRRRNIAEEHAAREAAGVPAQWRHEVLSVRMASRHLTPGQTDMDAALALYLIGSHHGHGRPFFPHNDPWDARAAEAWGATVPTGPGPERLDFDWHNHDWTELFAGLQAQYGPWGLAFLEAVLRLADHRASEQRS